ncbi:hypothetical protein DQW15_01480 [Mycoplasma capricolum subsp. capripneumoniae]|nr:hypothetical protein M1601_01470 [Mycoplasma capricolum subsp. capripneumoniae M1601]QDL19495.1 hypothetical protein DQW15_01480 [Mycoplasma capricolum subsp. capripneumoniae]QDL20180.1 hypothetical protein DQW16_01480 [Mycoplasma capricolum subsp. capripneumoniae]QDL20867.1 hypothetical protein DQW17_01480 [Mycoplasma capricolum subsp. capripneumoniae]
MKIQTKKRILEWLFIMFLLLSVIFIILIWTVGKPSGNVWTFFILFSLFLLSTFLAIMFAGFLDYFGEINK